MQRKCGRPPLAGCILDALTSCRRRCPVTRASQPLPTPTNIWSVRSHRRPWTVQPIWLHTACRYNKMWRLDADFALGG